MSIQQINPFNFYEYNTPSNPTINTNPKLLYSKWLNTATAELWICTDITVGNNVWINPSGAKITPFLAYGAKMHYDFSDPSGLFVSDLVKISTDGSLIKTIKDVSGNAYDLTQATEANRAEWVENGINGVPCARFSGNQWYSDLIAHSSAYTLFMVLSNQVSGEALQFRKVGNGTPILPTVLMAPLGTRIRNNASTLYTLQTSNTASNSTDPLTYIAWWTGTEIDYKINTTDYTALSASGATTCDIFSLGSGYNPSTALFDSLATVDIGEVLFFDSYLDLATRDEIQALLNTKWGIV